MPSTNSEYLTTGVDFKKMKMEKLKTVLWCLMPVFIRMHDEQ